MQINVGATVVTSPLVKLPALASDDQKPAGRKRLALSARAALARSESLENAAWAILAFVALEAVVVSFVY